MKFENVVRTPQNNTTHRNKLKFLTTDTGKRNHKFHKEIMTMAFLIEIRVAHQRNSNRMPRCRLNGCDDNDDSMATVAATNAFSIIETRYLSV